jgi:hypothetical protein
MFSRRVWPRTERRIYNAVLVGAFAAPISVRISADEGKTWEHYHDIDARPDRDAAYPFVFFQKDEAVVTYYTRPTSWARDTEVMQKIFRIDQFYD